MNYLIDNVKNYSKTRGWLCGHFVANDSILKTDNFEVKYCELEPGETVKEHFHLNGEDIFIVVTGKIKVKIDGEEHLLEKGDFVFEKSGTHEEIVEVIESTTLVAVRAPSVPDNKVEVK